MSTGILDADPLFTEAIVIARIIDAASGQPRTASEATTAVPHAFARIATGSFLVISGRPELVVPALATTAATLSATISFPDRVSQTVAITIPAGSLLPFRPSDIAVEMPAVSLQGTIVQEAAPHGGIPNATVTIAAAAPPALLALRTPLSLDHPAGAVVSTATVTLGAATAVSVAVDQGAMSVQLTSVAGCTTGGALALGTPSDLEHAVIAAVDALSRTVTLNAPLRRSRAQNAPAQAGTFSAGAPGTTLSRDAGAGDGVLEMAATLAAGVVQVAGAVPELRAAGEVTDVAGHWRLDGVRAIGSLTVAASATGFTPSTPLTYNVDYRSPNVIDLSLV